MATIDLGEAKALAMKARDEAVKLGGKAWERASPSFGKAWERASPTMNKLLEEPRSFLTRLHPQPEPEPPKAHWAMIAGVAAVGFVAGAAALGARKVAMQAMTHHADWFSSLKADHRLAEGLFDALLKTRDSETTKRKLILAKLTYALNKHAFEEENVVYPALREANRELAAKRLAGEHFEIKSALHELAEMGKDDPEFLTRVDALRVLVASHVREEEDEIYPSFQSAMSPEQNLKLTKAINREGLKLA